MAYYGLSDKFKELAFLKVYYLTESLGFLKPPHGQVADTFTSNSTYSIK